MKDPVKRKHYDRTGTITDDFSSCFWQAYEKYKSVEVTEEDIKAYVSSFHGSDQEEKDLFDFFSLKKGDISHILGSIIGSTDADVPRFIEIISKALNEGKLDTNFLPAFQESKDQILTVAELDGLGSSDIEGDSNDEKDSEDGDDDEDGNSSDEDSFIDNSEIIENESAHSSEDSEDEQVGSETESKYCENDAVSARWRKGPTFYDGVILKVNESNRTYDIKYDDNVVEKCVPEKLIKPQKPSANLKKQVKREGEIEVYKKNGNEGSKKRVKGGDDEYGDIAALRAAMLKKKENRVNGFESFANRWIGK